MAPRSARSPRGRKPVDGNDDEFGGVAAFLARNRLVAGGLTAFAVAFSYVAANAIWYQPHAHGSAFFQTRPLAAGTASGAQNESYGKDVAGLETIIRLEREPEITPVPRPQRAPEVETAMPVPLPSSAGADETQPRLQGDPTVEEVQRVLAGLNLYSGDVDGLTGPQTRAAIASYRKMVGLSESAEIDDQLLQQLGAAPRLASASPPLPQGAPGMDLIETSSAAPRGDAIVMRIQAGLRAFGNDGIEIDGVMGSRTKAAIREFQSLFGLPETGEPDQAVYAKMRDIGLTD